MKQYIFAIFVFVCQYLGAQNVTNGCNQLCNCESDLSDSTCIQILTKRIDSLDKTKSKTCLGEVYQSVAQVYERNYQNVKAISYYTLAAEVYKELDLINDYARCINYRGIVKENSLHYLDAANDYYLSLFEFTKTGNLIGMGNAYLNIGLINHYQKQHNEARYLFLKALDMYLKANHGMGISAAYNSLGMHYNKQKEYSKALQFYFATLKNDYAYNASDLEISYTLNNIGDVLECTGSPNSALHYYRMALFKKLYINDINGVAGIYNNFASVFITLGQYYSSIFYLNAANKLNEAYNFADKAVETYRNKYELSKRQNDFKRAIEYFQRYHEGKDSIIRAENDIEIEQTKSNYELKLANSRVEEQKTELDLQKKQRIFFLIIIVVVSLIALYLIYLGKIRMRLLKALRKKNEEIKLQNIAIKEAETKAIIASQAKSQFLSMMSHEIRTPLNAINSVIYLLDTHDISDIQKKHIEVLKSSTKHLISLVDDILDLSKIESGKLQLEKVSFDVVKLCHSIFDLFQVNANEKGLKYILQIDNDIQGEVLGDQTKLRQVLANLLSNAIKFTESGTVSLDVKVIINSSDLLKLNFNVTDTGIGIDKKAQEKIFDSFEQADFSTTRKYGGTGLGLSICKRIIEMLGSEIELKSNIGEGSSFSFELIFEKSRLPKQATLDFTNNDNQQLFTPIQAKILLVEDNELSAYAVSQIFSRWGIILQVANSGTEAIEIAASMKPDMVFMDIHLNDMNGFEATKMIHLTQPDIPVIAFSASSVEDEQLETLMNETNIKGFIPKPFDPSVLYQVVLKHMPKQ